jgi:hypothetical protein
VASGQFWSIRLMLGAGGDCYEFSAVDVPDSPEMGACGPVSTPDGPETIMALPLAYPPGADNGATGYADTRSSSPETTGRAFQPTSRAAPWPASRAARSSRLR